jgi:hypothetical protein
MEESTLSSNQMIAASLIALGEAKKKAAKAAKVSPQTISTWMQHSEFLRVIENLKIDILREAQDKLRGLTTEAVATIESLLRDSENERTKFDAAKYILDTAKIIPNETDLGLWVTAANAYEGAMRDQAMKDQPLSSILGDY